MQIIIGEGYIIKTLAISKDKKIGGLIICVSDKQNIPGEYIENFKINNDNILCDLVFTNKLAIDQFIEDLNKLKSNMKD